MGPSIVYGGISQQPERRLLAQAKHDTFVTSTYYQE